MPVIVYLYKVLNMVRAVVIPDHQEVSIHVPENYIGKRIEVLLYAEDELTDGNLLQKSNANLRGSLHLTNEEHKNFQQYLKSH
jgi:hypothetical protein